MNETIEELLQWAEGRLGSDCGESFRLDAQLLLGHVLETQRTQLQTQRTHPVMPAQRERFRELVARRARHEPVAYLTGTKEFWSLDFKVDSRVLIPRPDTETLLEEVADLFAERSLKSFVDVGCGSGCLACALTEMFPGSTGIAVDCDRGALSIARENAVKLGRNKQLRFVSGNLLEPVTNPVELIVANLPYIPSDEICRLPADVRDYEPCRALDGGPDGLVIIGSLIAAAPRYLAPGGWLVLEVGDGQAAEVSQLCSQAKMTRVHTRRDLAAVVRVVAACRGR